jgi:hypothetical protein
MLPVAALLDAADFAPAFLATAVFSAAFSAARRFCGIATPPYKSVG